MTRRVRSAHEQSLASEVAQHLRRQKYEVYGEVQMEQGGKRPDIVATPELAQSILVVECKMHLGLDVMLQAAKWRPYANWVAVATPPLGRSEDEAIKREILEGLKLGWIVVGRSGIAEPVPAPLLRTELGELGQHLREEHKFWALPGNADSSYFTVFRSDVQQLIAYVREHPRCTLEEILAAQVTHYRTVESARALVGLARKGKLGPIVAKHDGVRARFYCDDDAVDERRSA